MFGQNQYGDFSAALEMHDENEIHPTAIIGDEVQLGKGNYIGAFCRIVGNTIIGDNNHFEAYCSIGSPPEHKDFKNKDGRTLIGDNCWFREFITVNAGTIDSTKIMDGVIMLRGSHVGHDSYIGNNVTLSCNALIGGHSHIFEGANFGLGSVCHQYSIVGHYAMIGMNGTIVKKSVIMPGFIYAGNPVRMIGLNEIGLTKGNVTKEQLELFNSQFNEKCNHA